MGGLMNNNTSISWISLKDEKPPYGENVFVCNVNDKKLETKEATLIQSQFCTSKGYYDVWDVWIDCYGGIYEPVTKYDDSYDNYKDYEFTHWAPIIKPPAKDSK